MLESGCETSTETNTEELQGGPDTEGYGNEGSQNLRDNEELRRSQSRWGGEKHKYNPTSLSDLDPEASCPGFGFSYYKMDTVELAQDSWEPEGRPLISMY